MIHFRQRLQRLVSNLPKFVPKQAFRTTPVFKLHAPDALYNESFMNGTNAIYIENLYANWIKNRSSVPASWNAYFTNITKNLSSQDAFELPATISNQAGTAGATTRTAAIVPVDKVIESLRVSQLIQAYRRRGHEVAHLDPLGNRTGLACWHGLRLEYVNEFEKKQWKAVLEDLALSKFGFSEADLEREVFVDPREMGVIQPDSTAVS